MSRDYSKTPLDELIAERDELVQKVRELRALIEPMNEDIGRRDNARTLLRNAAMKGEAGVFLSLGVPREAIEEAEAWVKQERDRKVMARLGQGGAP